MTYSLDTFLEKMNAIQSPAEFPNTFKQVLLDDIEQSSTFSQVMTIGLLGLVIGGQQEFKQYTVEALSVLGAFSGYIAAREALTKNYRA